MIVSCWFWSFRRDARSAATCTRSSFVRGRLEVFENAFGERLMGSQKLTDILFEDELGMKFSPIVRGAHEA